MDTMTQYSTCSLNFWRWHQLKVAATVSVTCVLESIGLYWNVEKKMPQCLWEHKPLPVLLSYVLLLKQAINTCCQLRWSCHNENVFQGCCLKHQIRPILCFFTEFFMSFFHPSQIRLPLGCDFSSLAVWKVVSEGGYCIREVLIFSNFARKTKLKLIICEF